MSDPITDRLDAIEAFLATLSPNLASSGLSDTEEDKQASNARDRWSAVQGVWQAQHGVKPPAAGDKPPKP